MYVYICMCMYIYMVEDNLFKEPHYRYTLYINIHMYAYSPLSLSVGALHRQVSTGAVNNAPPI
jgi:hypothetical protein